MTTIFDRIVIETARGVADSQGVPADEFDAALAEALSGGRGAADPDELPVNITEVPTADMPLLPGVRLPSGRPVKKQISAAEARKRIRQMDEGEFRRWQDQFFAAGLYQTTDRSRIAWGDKTDSDTLKIWDYYVQAAGELNDAEDDRDLESIIGDSLSKRVAAGGGGSGRAPLTVELPSAADLLAVLRDTATEEGAGKLPDEVEQRIIAAYNKLLTDYQTKAYGNAESGGTVERPPEFETFATEQIEQAAPESTQANDLLGAYNGMLEDIRSLNGAAVG